MVDGIPFLRKFPIILCFILYHSNSSQVFASQSSQCKKHRPATSVRYVIKPIEYIRSIPSKDLTAYHYGGHISTNKVLGLAGGEVGTNFTAKFKIKALTNGLYCINVKEINANFYANPQIHIASNFKRGSCEYNNVLKHEHEHVTILKRVHKEYLPLYREYVQEISRDIPVLKPMTLSETYAQKEYFIRYINDKLGVYVKHITDDVAERQKEIDTPENYREEQEKCKRWEEKLQE